MLGTPETIAQDAFSDPHKQGSLALHEPEPTVKERFENYFRQQQGVYVYDSLVKLARQLLARGFKRYAIAGLFEQVRWHFQLERGPDDDDFKLNNNYKPHYARLIMEREPDLRGFFETRGLKS